MDLKQLSQLLALSQTTISRALNGYSDVSERTRERVIAAAQEHGYQPNSAARLLAVGRAEAVGIVFPTGSGDLGDPHFLKVVSGLTERCALAGIDVLIASAPPAGELATYERLLRKRRVDGYIVPHTRCEDARISYLREQGVPFVAYGRCTHSEDFAWFDFDNEAGTVLAVQRLHALGHRRIAYVHAPTELNFAHQRLQGYLRSMRSAGLEPLGAHVIAAPFSQLGGHQAAASLMKAAPAPTAILVDNYVSGVGVVRSLLDMGLQLPEDVSVVVYDGIPQDSPLSMLGVSSIEQPDPTLAGQCLAELMLGLNDGKPASGLQVLWQPSFEEGRTIRAPSCAT